MFRKTIHPGIYFGNYILGYFVEGEVRETLGMSKYELEKFCKGEIPVTRHLNEKLNKVWKHDWLQMQTIYDSTSNST